MEGFYRKMGGGMSDLSTKEKKGLFLGQDILFWLGRDWQGFLLYRLLLLSMGGGWRGPR